MNKSDLRKANPAGCGAKLIKFKNAQLAAGLNMLIIIIEVA